MHRLLQRQLRKLGLSPDNLPAEWQRLVSDIDEAYASFDGDRAMLERSLELSSKELLAANNDIRASEELLRRTLQATADGVLAVDGQGSILHVNERYFEILELPRDLFEIADMDERLATIAERLVDPQAFIDKMKAVRSGEIQESFDVLRLKIGRVVERSSRPLNVLNGPSGRVWSYRDVTERERLEEQLRHQAFHDPLTDLANRARFLDRLEHALERSRRSKALVAVLFLDIDNFKSINDSLGHTIGDRVIMILAKRLAQALSAGDTAARLGGDEFGIVLEDLMSVDEARRVAEQMLTLVRVPIEVDDKEIVAAASIGIAAGDSLATGEELVRNADIAMYAAKNSGKGRVQTYEMGMHTRLNERQSLLADLWHALERDELAVYYQPSIHLETNQLAGAEALVRWNHPTWGLLPPARFIPLAEETSIILDIGLFVLRDACRLIKEWERRFLDNALLTSVNVSAKQIHDPGFVDAVRRVMEETQINPKSLVLEITESAVLEDPVRVQDTLNALKDLGLKLALDDFGTGYSSLSYLRQFPIDVLKIDRSFISEIDLSEKESALTSATVALGQKLRLTIVAEGIEKVEQLEHLQALNCEFGQGFLFAQPLTREDLDRFVDASVVEKAADDAA